MAMSVKPFAKSYLVKIWELESWHGILENSKADLKHLLPISSGVVNETKQHFI